MPKTRTHSLRNTFHGSWTTVRVPADTGRMSARQARRVRDSLCGVTGCGCWHHECHDDGYTLTVGTAWDTDTGRAVPDWRVIPSDWVNEWGEPTRS